MKNEKLRIGFIPLADAAALIIAADRGFLAAEGLDVELVREVSWSNVRDKLNIGLFDAAHLLAPVAIASSLGLGHVTVPIVALLNLALNGNAITVAPELYRALADAGEGDMADPRATAAAYCSPGGSLSGSATTWSTPRLATCCARSSRHALAPPAPVVAGRPREARWSASFSPSTTSTGLRGSAFVSSSRR